MFKRSLLSVVLLASATNSLFSNECTVEPCRVPDTVIFTLEVKRGDDVQAWLSFLNTVEAAKQSLTIADQQTRSMEEKPTTSLATLQALLPAFPTDSTSVLAITTSVTPILTESEEVSAQE